MKNILVTGGSGTIGSAIVDTLIAHDYKVWVMDIKPPAEKRNQAYINCDITRYDEIRSSLGSNFKDIKLDGLITVAGGALKGEWNDFSTTDIEVIKKSVEVNLLGHIYAVHAILPYLGESNNKSITMISSINGMAAYRLAGYSASKAGLQGFMLGVAKELGKAGIRINLVSPGTVVTELTLRETKKDWNKLREGTLTGNFVCPEDIADLVLTIVRNQSIDGQNFIIDSGQLVKK